MPNIFLIADTHYGHQKLVNERGFTSVDEMDDYMITLWNSVVKTNDKVYHLGDAVINKKCLKTFDKLNGDKVLIKGNHDIFKLKEYTPYFRDIRATHKLENFILTHIPIHPFSMTRWADGNIHGHLHTELIPDSKYFCVSVEQIGYCPVEFGELKETIKKIQENC